MLMGRRRKRRIKILGLIGVIAFFSVMIVSLNSTLTGNAVAIVNGKKILASELDKEYNLYFVLNDIPKSYASLIPKAAFLNQTIITDLVYDDAVSKGFNVSFSSAKVLFENTFPNITGLKQSLVNEGISFDYAVDFFKRELVINEFLNKTILSNISVSDEAVSDFYNSNKDKFFVDDQIRVSHILVNSSDLAVQIINKLNDGANFSDLAKAYSTGPSGPNGGDLGYFSNGSMVKEFNDAAFALENIGDYTHEPVHTQYGYHIIMLTGKKPAHNLTLNESYDNIKNYLVSNIQKERINNYIKSILSNNDIVILLKSESSQSVQQQQSIPKSSKPVVELFVMSYCPYGTQSEKGIIPAVEALGDKVDFKLRFVYYAMHGQKELNENLRQYCIQKEQPSKLLDYLKCFLESGDYSSCLESLNLNVSDCMINADEEFSITSNFNDKSSWLSGQFPLCDIDKSLNTQYQVRGSPTLIINGVQARPSSRSPQSYLNVICSAFTSKPSACSESLSNTAYSPGFGYSTSNSEASGSCS